MYRLLTLQSSKLCYILISQLLVLLFAHVLFVKNGAKGLGVVAPKKRNLPTDTATNMKTSNWLVRIPPKKHLFCLVNNIGLITRKLVFSLVWCNVSVVNTSVFKLVLYSNKSVISFVISPCTSCKEYWAKGLGVVAPKKKFTKQMQLQIWKLQIDCFEFSL